jgi:hypothetical protein
LQQYCPGHGI